MYSLIGKIKKELEKVDGISDLRIDDVIGDDEVFIQIDEVKAARLGLNTQNIGSNVRP